MRVLFWGTPAFATPALRALIGEAHDVVAVVTQPDRPQKRSRSALIPSPVKEVAIAESVPVLQPDRPRGENFLEQMRQLAPDISIVVAYGHILPRDVIELPSHGTLNIHASLLPLLRGAAPIQAAIRDGLNETGVTIMRMVSALDAGPVLLRSPTPILADETYGELQLRLSELGAVALLEAMALLSVGMAHEQPQDDSMATYAPKIDRDAARIDWTNDSERVARMIRAYDPKPGAFTRLRGTDVKMFGARAVSDRSGDAGCVLEVGEAGMLVACGQGAARVSYVHPSGRRRLAALEWFQGRGVQMGDQFGE